MTKYRLDIHNVTSIKEHIDDADDPVKSVEFNADGSNDACDKAKIILEQYQDKTGNVYACGFVWDGSNDWRDVAKITA